MISDPRKFVRKWLISKSIAIDERGSLQSPDNFTNDEIFGKMFLDYKEAIAYFNLKADKKIPSVDVSLFKMAFEEYISEYVAAERKKVFERVKFVGVENLVPLKLFVSTLTGAESPQIVAIFAHFLWAVKRRMTNKDTFDQIMPIIFGKQKAGKSLAIKHLVAPLGELQQKLTLPQVVDSRYQMSFGRTYAVVIDEMAGANKTDIDALKNLITANDMDIRKLHGNNVYKIRQNVNLIGTTNRPVVELIYDPTGARRFYQVNSLDKVDINIIMTGIDYMALWQGIDETKAQGYLVNEIQQIEKDQESLIVKEDIQVFLDTHKIKPGNKQIPFSVIYENYRLWCDSNGSKISSSPHFGRKLRGKGFKEPIQRSIKGKNTQIYFISEEATDMHEKANYTPLELVGEK
jgi:Virulence-associated protein E